MRYCSRNLRVRASLHCIATQIVVWTCAFVVAALACSAQDAPRFASPSPEFSLTCILNDTQGRPLSDIDVEIRSARPPLERILSTTQPDGAYTFLGLKPGAYDITVAGGMLLPPKRVHIDSRPVIVTLQLPVTLPQPPGKTNDLVSVEQLNVPAKVTETLRKAYDAWMKNDLQRSRALAVRALELHPDYGPALSLVGILDLQEGHPTDAVNGLLAALRHDPDSPRTYLALASAYNRLHLHDEALQALSIMAKLAPETWQLHYEAGRARLGQGRFEAAMREFDRAQPVTQPETMLLHLGKAHAMLGLQDYSGARAELETIMQKSPDGPYTAESRRLALVVDSHFKKTPATPESTALGVKPQGIEH